jgi:serine O-acetyltransferase
MEYLQPANDISAIKPDWGREAKGFWQWHPSRSLLASIRTWQRCQHSRNPILILRRRIAVIQHRFWSAVTGADIPVNCQLGGGLLIPHPNGIVIHPHAIIGVNCLIFQQVTIGQAHAGVPKLGGHVDVGAGAKILGNVRIGDHALVGANSVVINDVDSHRTVVGIPARYISNSGGSTASG